MKYVFKKRWMRASMALIDTAGALLYAPFKFFRRKPGRISRIAVLRLDLPGDMVQALVFFASLRKKYPEARITAVCSKTSRFMLEGNADIDSVIAAETGNFYAGRGFAPGIFWGLARSIRKLDPDIAFDLKSDIRSLFLLKAAGARWIISHKSGGGGFWCDSSAGDMMEDEHEIDRNLRLLGEAPVEKADIKFPTSDADDSEASRITAGAGEKKIIIHPFAGHTSRLWGFGRYNELIKRILASSPGATIFITGGPGDIEHAGKFSFGGRVINVIGLKFPPTIALIKKCDVFIGNDSSLQYFAAYSGVRTCVIYGYVAKYSHWLPKTGSPEKMKVLSIPVPCGPCELKVCNQKSHFCMDMIGVDSVADSLKEWI
jgi:heptosyltransferase-2